MSQVINTNIASLNAQRNLNSSQSQLNVSLERLSSGLRINSAKDDAAGLAISERFTAQINGNNQAVRNANDGISFAQTAEGALEEIGNIAQRIRELAVQSANDTNSSSDRQALNNEVDQLVAEAGRIAEATQFNDQNVLDGSLEELLFQVGANQGQTISVDGVDARAGNLGARVSTGDVIDFAEAFDTAGDLDLSDFTVNGAEVEVGDAETLDDVVAAINAVGGEAGVEAQRADEVEATITNLGDFVATAGDEGTISFQLNDETVTFDGDDNDTTAGENLAAAINDAGISGVTAEYDDGEVVLTGEGVDLEFERSENGTEAVGLTLDGLGDLGTDDGNEAGAFRAIEFVGALGENVDVEGDDIGNIGLDADFSDTDNFDEQSLTDVDISTRDGASDAIGTMDFVLQQVNGLRADLGAVQNRFESTVANLNVTSENLEASRSRILDADFAAETAALTRGQILQQAGTSVLAQANQIPNNVLGLLQ